MQINLYTGRLYGLGFPADMGFNVLLFCTWVGIPHQSPSLCSGLSPGAGRQSPPANHPSFCPRGSSNGIELWEAGPIHLPYWGNEARVLNGFSIQQRDSLVLLWGKFSTCRLLLSFSRPKASIGGGVCSLCWRIIWLTATYRTTFWNLLQYSG